MLQWIDKIYNRNKKTAAARGLALVAVFCLFVCFFQIQNNTVKAQSVSQSDPNSELMQGVQIIEEPLGLPSTDIRLVIARIIRTALAFLGIVVLVIILYAGFLWMTAGGNEEQIERAKKTLRNAVIGLAIILSAYAIVAFIMRMLGVGMGVGGMGGVGVPGITNFRGSGALGRVIKDHYPVRNQINVPRNTKIVVSFFRPIRLADLVSNTNNTRDANGNDILGDCKTPLNSWETDCDSLNLGNNLINISRVIPATTTTGTPTYEPIRGAALLAQQTAPGPTDPIGVYTIVIRPYDYLGSETENVSYLVRIGSDVKRDDANLGNPGIFDGLKGSKYYEWIFTCGTELDLTPPHVTYVYPEINSVEYKNTVIQIGFNEPMDPIGVQGFFASSSNNDYYFLKDGFIYLKNSFTTMPVGIMNLVNNYQTLEFTPSVPCGKNACGGTIYCLPVCDAPGANCDRAPYEMLLKAALTINENTFESQPFTGVADICGNALDDNDGKVETAPLIQNNFDTGKSPDNYWWNFSIKDEMDLIPPIVSQVVPGPEAPWIEAGQDWSMWFDKRMRIEPMYSIDIQESPTPEERCACYKRTPSPENKCVALPGNQCVLDLIWKLPFVSFASTTPITRTQESHGLFLDGLPQGYIPNIDSRVEDAHFNCLYPGQGPLSGAPYADDKFSGFCDKNPANCCIENGAQVLCCNGVPASNNAADCIGTLETPIK